MSSVNLEIAPASGRFEGDDESWLGQVNKLYDDLQAEAGGLSRNPVAQPGSKGALEATILALGSAGAFRAAVQCWRAWLSQDRTRRLEINWNIDGRQGKVSVDSTRIDQEDFRRFTEIVSKEIHSER